MRAHLAELGALPSAGGPRGGEPPGRSGGGDGPPPALTLTWLGPGALRALLVQRYRAWTTRRRWARLRGLGMHLGKNVNLPASVWIDTSHCHLISIGDECGFGEGVCILAHDALANEFLDATRVGRVIIHRSCHVGARAVILPGVEIGPRSIVGANAVVTRSVPPGTVVAGSPAHVLCSLDEYLARMRERMATSPRFDWESSDLRRMSPARREQMAWSLRETDGFIVGGASAQAAGRTDQEVTGEQAAEGRLEY